MPVSPTPPDDYYFEIARAYQQAELEILGQIKTRLLKGATLDDLDWQTARLAEVQQVRKQAVQSLAKVNSKMTSKINGAFGAAYKDGEWAALKDAQAYLPDKPTAVSSATRQASVRAAAGAIHGGLTTTMPKLLRTLEDDYARVVNSTVLRVQAGSGDRRSATGKALQEAFGKGLKTGPNGKMNLPDYITMAMRTGVANTSIQGHLDSLAANDLDLVYIQPGPRHCELCDEWSNKPLWRGNGAVGQQYVPSLTEDKPFRVMVWGTLDQAKAAGWGHPNCRCSVGAFLPGATVLPKPRPKWDKDGYEAQQAQRVMERKIREWKVKQTLATDPKEAALAAGKVAEWQETVRKHVAAHPELKRQYARESTKGIYGPGVDGGNAAPKPPKASPAPSKTSPAPTTPPAAPAAPEGLSDAAKIKNAETMYGTNSPQHVAALKKWGQYDPDQYVVHPDGTPVLNGKGEPTKRMLTPEPKYVDGIFEMLQTGKLTPAQLQKMVVESDKPLSKLNGQTALDKYLASTPKTTAPKPGVKKASTTDVEFDSRRTWANASGADLPTSNLLTRGSPVYKDAARNYAGAGYTQMNDVLRRDLEVEEGTRLSDHLKAMKEITTKQGTTTDATMHRVVDDLSFLNRKYTQDFLAQEGFDGNQLVGKSFTDKGFTSVSYGEGSGYSSAEGMLVQMEIEVPKGTRGSLIDNPDEREFVLAPGTKFTIVDAVFTDGGFFLVRVVAAN